MPSQVISLDISYFEYGKPLYRLAESLLLTFYFSLLILIYPQPGTCAFPCVDWPFLQKFQRQAQECVALILIAV